MTLAITAGVNSIFNIMIKEKPASKETASAE